MIEDRDRDRDRERERELYTSSVYGNPPQRGNFEAVANAIITLYK